MKSLVLISSWRLAFGAVLGFLVPAPGQAQVASRCDTVLAERATLGDSDHGYATLKSPRSWTFNRIDVGTALLTVSGAAFQVRISSLAGRALTESDIHAMDESLKLPRIGEWKARRAGSAMLYSTTHRTVQTLLYSHYLVRDAQLIHVTLEHPGQPDRCLLRQFRLLVESIELLGAGTTVASSDGACPRSLIERANADGGACLEPQVVGPARAQSCGEELVRGGFKRDVPAEAALGEQTGKALRCYARF